MDPEGLAYWTTRLDSGEPLSIIADLLTHTDEYFSTIIKPAYIKFLGRQADPNGLTYWTGQLRGGLTDEQLEAGFIAAPEYYAHNGGTDRGWIDGIYVDLLGRLAEPEGETYWIGQAMQTSRFTVAQIGRASCRERV